MSGVKYYAGTVGTSDVLYAKAYDGNAWTDTWVSWTQASGRANNALPVVSMVSDKRLFIPDSWTQLTTSQLLGSNNLMVSDADQDTIQRYRVTTDGRDSHVQWYVNFAVITAGSAFEFTTADVTAGRVYYRGLTAGSDVTVR